MATIHIFLLLVAAHFVADYPLQGEFLAIQKNPWLPPEKRFAPWYQAMGAHAAIHAGAVLLITNSMLLALLEFVVHYFIDITKCAGGISYNTDQGLHLMCKAIWAYALFNLMI